METRGVQINAKQLVNSLQSRRVAGDRIAGWSKTICILIPWRRARKDKLYDDRGHVHVAECACPYGEGSGRTPDEHAAANNNGRHVMYNAIWYPCHKIQNYVLVRGEDVAQIGTIEYIFEGRQDADPGSRAIFGGDIPVAAQLACLHDGLCHMVVRQAAPRGPSQDAICQCGGGPGVRNVA